jgi:hypothetical protein
MPRPPQGRRRKGVHDEILHNSRFEIEDTPSEDKPVQHTYQRPGKICLVCEMLIQLWKGERLRGRWFRGLRVACLGKAKISEMARRCMRLGMRLFSLALSIVLVFCVRANPKSISCMFLCIIGYTFEQARLLST